MNRTEELELTGGGEDSRVDFKRHDCQPERLAKEMAALLNLEEVRTHNGTEPDLLEQDDRFLVRLWTKRSNANRSADT